ncbi:hypothetical protein [Ponticoccus sp. (in: a-proteobacteria)]|uniref:hypothetical protein n=1 Tax=Ponticoccus sp. (in: a-proteobacteria) TaxID=1925025 RepID=UPI003AB71D3A
MHRDHCLMVLGMHRSGTSALTGVLRQSGLYLGAALDSAIPLNPTGLQEAPSVLHMHEDLLNANGGCWHAPPDRVTWGKLHCAVRDLFIESRIGTGLWGFKDPRTLLVIDGWIEVLPRWSAIGIFRAPQAVTRSLMARNGLEEAACHRLWHAYNSRLLRLHRLYDIPLIAFRSDAQATRADIARVLTDMGLTPDTGLLDGGIPNHGSEADEDSVPDALLGLWQDLQAAAHVAA